MTLRKNEAFISTVMHLQSNLAPRAPWPDTGLGGKQWQTKE